MLRLVSGVVLRPETARFIVRIHAWYTVRKAGISAAVTLHLHIGLDDMIGGTWTIATQDKVISIGGKLSTL